MEVRTPALVEKCSISDFCQFAKQSCAKGSTSSCGLQTSNIQCAASSAYVFSCGRPLSVFTHRALHSRLAPYQPSTPTSDPALFYSPRQMGRERRFPVRPCEFALPMALW